MAPRALSSLALKDVPLPQFIVALLLVKSKPTCLTTKEYLTSLRSCIRQGKRHSNDSAPQSHVDTTAFWRDAYTKSEESQIVSRARIASLESTQGLKESNDLHEASQPLQSQRKRKREEPQVGSRKLPGRLVKQIRAANISSPRQAKAVQAQHQISSAKASVVDDVVTAFLHHVYTLQQLTSEIKATPQAMHEHFNQICTTLRQLVSFIDITKLQGPATRNPLQSSSHSYDDIQSHNEAQYSMELMVLRSIKSFLPTLFGCLSALVEAKQRLSQHFTHMVIILFQDIVDRVCELAIAKTSNKPSPGAGLRSVCQGQAIYAPSLKQHDESSSSGVLSALCELATLLLRSCDTTKAAHNNILEGCLFLLMKRIGSGLKKFSIDKRTKSQDQGQADPQSTVQSRDNMELQAQAPYLIYIFEQAQTLMEEQTQVSTLNDKSQDRPGLVVLKTRSISITGMARTKLQNTLLNAVFDELPGEPFRPSLSRVVGSQALPGLELEGREVEDWFKHEVWRLLGWDILRSHLGLA